MSTGSEVDRNAMRESAYKLKKRWKRVENKRIGKKEFTMIPEHKEKNKKILISNCLPLRY